MADHHKLINYLEWCFGTRDARLALSSPYILRLSGIPQGSILGAIFVLYLYASTQIIHKYNLNFNS